MLMRSWDGWRERLSGLFGLGMVVMLFTGASGEFAGCGGPPPEKQECRQDSDCLKGYFCDAMVSCLAIGCPPAGPGVCRKRNVKPPPPPVCREDAQCAAGERCVDGRCIQKPKQKTCQGHDDCGPQQRCEYKIPPCPPDAFCASPVAPSHGVCVEKKTSTSCQDDSDCASGLGCHRPFLFCGTPPLPPGTCMAPDEWFCESYQGGPNGESCVRCYLPRTGETLNRCSKPKPKPNCAAQDARGSGVCTVFFGYAFDGQSCQALGGCSCVGHDCSSIFKTKAACEKAYSTCSQPKPTCAAQDAHGDGLCNAFFGYAFDGQSCRGISGCSCKGKDCDKTFSSQEACEKAHNSCQVKTCTTDADCAADQRCEHFATCTAIGCPPPPPSVCVAK